MAEEKRNWKQIGIGLLAAIGVIALILVFTPRPNIIYSCDAKSGPTSSLQYGLSGQCTFKNVGSASGNLCVTVELRESGSIANTQQLCTSVPAQDTVVKEFFMGEALLGKQYTWDVVNG